MEQVPSRAPDEAMGFDRIALMSMAIAGAVVAASGCGLTRHWKVDLDADIPAARTVRPAAATVAVVLPPGFRERESQQTSTFTSEPYGSVHHVYHTDIGAVTATWLTRCLARSFAEVVPGDPSDAGATMARPWALAFEPVDPQITFGTSIGFGTLIDRRYLQGVHTATYDCTVRVRGPDGRPLAEWPVHGWAQVDATWTGTDRHAYKSGGDQALADACAALTVQLMRNPVLAGPAPPATGSPPGTVDPSPAGRLVAIQIAGDFTDADDASWTTRHADTTEQADLEQCLRGVEEAPAPYDLSRYRRELYPWLERATAPGRLAGWLELARDPAVAGLSASLGVRYWLLWSVSDHHAPTEGGILCGGGGCLGLMWAERTSSYRGVLIDVLAARVVEHPAATATGTTAIPAYVLPLPLVAPTYALACTGMAKALAAAIRADRARR
jgi:hypothetical protein